MPPKHDPSNVQLHDLSCNPKGSEFNVKKPFIGTVQLEESEKNIYGCAFNQYLKWPETPIAAVVGSLFVHVYAVPVNEAKLIRIKSVNLTFKVTKATDENPNPDELYTVAWCRDDDKYQLVCGGCTGRLFVLDYESMQFVRELRGCGGEVNDIRTCPTLSTLIAVASKDFTVRVFDIRATACLVICGGAPYHVDNVLSVDWTPNGEKLVSGGIDHKIIGWDLSTTKVKKHLTDCIEYLDKKSEIPRVKFEEYAYDPRIEQSREVFNLEKYTMFVTIPAHEVTNIHYDKVDCVRVIRGGAGNNKNIIISKGCGSESRIAVWRFGTYGGVEENVPVGQPSTTHLELFRKQVNSGDQWFRKFGVDPLKKWVIVGGKNKTLQFHDLRDEKNMNPKFTIKVNEPIRQVAFCAKGQIVLAVGDAGIVCRLDRVAPSVQNPKHLW